jgi:hypothetical protein
MKKINDDSTPFSDEWLTLRFPADDMKNSYNYIYSVETVDDIWYSGYEDEKEINAELLDELNSQINSEGVENVVIFTVDDIETLPKSDFEEENVNSTDISDQPELISKLIDFPEEFETKVEYFDINEKFNNKSDSWRSQHPIINDWEDLIVQQQGRMDQIISFDISGENFHKLLITKSVLKNNQIENYDEVVSDVYREKKEEHATALNRINGARFIIARTPLLAELGVPCSGIMLSCNGLPISQSVSKDISGGIGYLKNMHIVIDVDETLGYGKRNPGTRMKYYYKIVKGIWPILMEMATLVVGNESGSTGHDFKANMKRMSLFKVEREIMSEYFGRASPPKDENGVIAAHNYYLGRKKSTAIKPNWVAYSQSSNIDALRLKDDIAVEELENLDSSRTSKVAISQCMKVEYKLDSAKLIESNDKANQSFRDYEIGVAWKSIRKEYDGYTLHWDKNNATENYEFLSQCWVSEGHVPIGNDGNGIYLLSLEIIYNTKLKEKITPIIDSLTQKKNDGTISEPEKRELKLLNSILKRANKELGLYHEG